MGLQELSEAQAQDGFVLLLEGRVAPEFEDCDLATRPPMRSPHTRLKGRVGRAGNFVCCTSLTDIHPSDIRS